MSDVKNYELDFTESYQEAIVGYCLVDIKFFRRCMDKLKADWFTCRPAVKTIYIQMVTFYKEYGYAPSLIMVNGQPQPEVMFNEPFFMNQSPLEMEKFRAAVVSCLVATRGCPIETIQKRMTGWLRHKMFAEALVVGAGKLNKGNYEDAYDSTNKKLRDIQEATFFDEFETVRFDGVQDMFMNRKGTDEISISTGCKKLDQAMGGGLFKGETCAIMAPTNTGKSKALMTMARHAAVNGHKVLYISHEDNEKRITERLVSSVVGLPPRSIESYLKKSQFDFGGIRGANGEYPYLDESVREYWARTIPGMLKDAEDLLNRNLVYLPFIKTGKMFVEDVIDKIKKLNEMEIQNGRPPFDMVVDDYPKKLKLRHGGGKGSIYRVELAEVYDMFNQLAAEINVHCLVAIQTNRTGAQMNKGRIEVESYLGNEEIDEAYGIAQNMGSVITLNRSDDDKLANIIHYNVSKSRNDLNNVTVSTRANYGANILHGDWNMFQRYGTSMLNKPLGSVYRPDNKKEPTSHVLEGIEKAEANDKIVIEAQGKKEEL